MVQVTEIESQTNVSQLFGVSQNIFHIKYNQTSSNNHLRVAITI